MKWSSPLVVQTTLALFATEGVAGYLTTIEPCPSATGLDLAPITVSTQYQPVSTCDPSTACVKGKCSTIYPFTTYPYVSTVVPCAWNGTTTQTTTVTDVAQPIKASEYLETLTRVTAAPTVDKRSWIDWFKAQGDKDPWSEKDTTLYETVTRRAMAPYNAIGPLPIPGWEGSGLCQKCESEGDDQGRSQLLDVIECRAGTNELGKSYEKCVEWYETLIEQPPTSVTAEALCSSQGKIPHAGTYTWTFPQFALPVTVTAPPTTVTVTVNGRPSISVHPNIQIIPGQPWDACVTKSYSGPTTFEFNIYITKVLIFELPHFTQPGHSTRPVPLPTGSYGSGGWPLPDEPSKGGSYYGGGQPWIDWESSTSTNPPSNGRSTTTSVSSGGTGPIGGVTTSSSLGYGSTSGGSGPVGAATTSSYASITTASSSSSSTSSITATGSGFYLQISAIPAPLRPRQLVTRYLGFDSANTGIAVDGLAGAALVFRGSDNDTFLSNNLFMGTSVFRGSPVQRFFSYPAGFADWEIVGIFADLVGTTGFCLDQNGIVSVYIAPATCDNPIKIIPTYPSTTSSSSAGATATSVSFTSATASTLSSSSGLVGPIGQSSTASSGASSSTGLTTASASTTSGAGSSVGPVGGGSTSSGLSTSSNVISSLSSTGASSLSASSSAGGSSSLTTPVSTSSVASTASASPTTPLLTTTGSATTSAAAATTTTSGPICNLNVNVCLNSQLLTANSVVTYPCPLLGGLLCTVNDLLALVPQLLNSNPNVLSVLVGDNQVIGLSLTPAQVAAAANAGELDNAVCDLLGGPISVVIRDPTCPPPPSASSSTSSSASTSFVSSSASASFGSSATSTSFGSSSTLTTTATITTSAAAATTTTSGPICNLNVNVCLNSQLLTANSVVTAACPLLGGLLCTVNDLLALIPQLLNSNPNVLSVLIGDNQVIGLSLTPAQVAAAVNAGELDNAVCDLLGGPISVVIRDPTCPPPPPTSSTSTSASTSFSSSSTLTTTATTTTSAAAATSTLPAVQCDAQTQFCAPLVVAFTIRSQVCPNVLGCSNAQMQAFANSFIGQPGVKSIAYANNIAYGFSLTTSQLEQQLGLLGPLNSICTSAPILTLDISDVTCPAIVIPTPQCNVDVAFCTLESLASAGITQGTCTTAPLVPCLTEDEVIDSAISTCNSLGSACLAYGTSLLTPLTASQSVAQIQQDIAAFALSNLCVAGTTVTLSDASCQD